MTPEWKHLVTVGALSLTMAAAGCHNDDSAPVTDMSEGEGQMQDDDGSGSRPIPYDKPALAAALAAAPVMLPEDIVVESTPDDSVRGGQVTAAGYNPVPVPIPAIQGWTEAIYFKGDPSGATRESVVVYTNREDAADTDFLDFGYWGVGTTDATGSKYVVQSFFRGEQPYGSVLNITGRATFEGTAVGLYALREEGQDGAVLDADQFTAEVSLTAQFGKLAGIGGTVSGFRDSLDNPIDPDWSVSLDGTLTDSDGAFSGSATGGGAWSGQFFGDASRGQPPSGVAGQFTARLDNGDLMGSFGAEKN